jgi:ppGpp synthetase/RelA/SpoT-type nucleotidyltranferase
MDIEQARAEWIRVRPEYRDFAELLRIRLQNIARELGIYAEISAREKEVHSLIKKLIRKPHLSYETMPDKVGARVVIRYRSELSAIEERIKQRFQFRVVEDKGTKLGTDKVGYQSIHVDGLALKVDDQEAGRFPPDQFFGELQIRSYGQHFWSEVTHDTFYKNDELVNELSPDLRRRVNLTAGLVEVADREFDRMKDEAQPGAAAEIFSGLEKLYYSVATKRPDVELSLEVISLVLPLYGAASPQEILQQHVIPTFERYRQDLEKIYSDPDNDYGGASAFFFQPEALLILDRLYFDRDQLLATWNQQFPPKELERVAENFGVAFND